MKQTVFLVFFALLAPRCLAQINLSVQTQPATCSANGSISATASGGTAPYSYEIIAPASGIRPPQTSGQFLNLPPAVYTVKVTATSGGTATATGSVQDQYDEPTMTCALSQNTVTMTTTNGRPPFKYEASIDNFATITRSIASTQDRTIAFNCLANGSYAFRVTDACNNIYTCNKVIQLAQLHAEWVCQGTGTIQLVSASGGTTPYTYLCYPRTGAVRTSTNGTFTGVTECRDSVVIHDACGGYFSQIVSCIFGNPTPLSLALTCSNGTLGTATVVATGGTPPYAFRETSSQVNNTTGHFTGLRNNVLFHFDVIDACGRTAFAEISSLNVFQQALECSWGVHLHTKQQRLATNTSGVFVDFSFKPVTYKCLTCVPQITLTDAVGDADNSVYFPTVGDAQLFEIKNGCGEKDTVEIGRASCITSDCNNNLYVLQTNTTIGGTTTVTLKNSAGVVLGTNTTGIFPNTPEGDYIITCHNPNGIPQTITYNYNLKLRIIGKREECDEVKIFYCPVNTSSTFKLYNELTGALVASNSTGVFTGLGHGTDFMVKVYDTHGILVDTISVATPGIKSFVTSTTCTSITASTVLQVVDSQNRPVTYTATNAAGMVVATNTTGSFPGLTAGLYTVTAAHPTCGSTSQLANVGAAAIRCLKPSFKSVGNACKFAWDVLFEQIGRITGGPDNVNISTTAGPGSSTWIRQLRPGSYSFITTCGTYPITLPAPAMPALTYDAYSTCPTNGRITVHGGQTKSNWLGQGLTMSVCADTNDVFQVYNEAGSLKIEEKEVRNASTTFYNLNAGTSYRVYHRIRDALGVLSCPIDTISFSMPFYTRPDLTASFGVVCNGTQGSIALNVINGNPPFTYKLLTGPVTRPDVTNRATSYTFANLPQGAYTFRVSDTCGISADYSTAVGTLSFTPIATRFCNGCVKLEVPTIANASYTWKRGTTSIGTTATTTVCNAAAAATYTVSVSVATCSYSTTIAVAAQVAPLTANAGTDFATLSSTANLAATAAPTGAAGTWTQIAPSSGTTVFSDSHSPSSQITVSVNPGIYTYIWSVQNTAGGCIATDTVKVGIQSCTSIPTLTGTTNFTAPTVCGGNGSATTTPTGGVPPYTYRWSTNSTAQTVALPYGSYTVTIEDASPCGSAVVKTVNIPRGGPAPTLSSIDRTICSGSSYAFYGTNYSTAGTYTHDVVSVQGCVTNRITLHLHAIAPIAQAINRTICAMETVVFNGKTYTATGNYRDTLPSLLTMGCDSILYDIRITTPQGIAQTQTKTICAGETVTVNGHIYTTAGVFKDTLKTVTRHCDSIRLTTTIQYLQPAPSSVSRLICKGDSLTINGHIHKLTGTYLDTLKAFRGCDSSYLTTNLTAVQVELVATNNATICNYLPRGDVQTVTTGGTAPYTYAWSNNLPAQSFQHCLERGIYTVTVTDMNGCKAIRPLSVVYNDLEGCLELEEGITPNGDGKNDTWEVPCLIDVKNSLVLYNRWGQLVYEAVDYKGGFEGIYNGHLLPDGVYYYIITIDGSIPHYSVSNYSVRKGNLTIMRH